MPYMWLTTGQYLMYYNMEYLIYFIFVDSMFFSF